MHGICHALRSVGYVTSLPHPASAKSHLDEHSSWPIALLPSPRRRDRSLPTGSFVVGMERKGNLVARAKPRMVCRNIMSTRCADLHLRILAENHTRLECRPLLQHDHREPPAKSNSTGTTRSLLIYSYSICFVRFACWKSLGSASSLFCQLLGCRRSGADPPGLDRCAAIAGELLDRTHIPLDDPVVDIGDA